MSWKVGLQDTDFDPEIHGDVDFSFFSEDGSSGASSVAVKVTTDKKPPEPIKLTPPDITISSSSDTKKITIPAVNGASALDVSYSDEEFESSSGDCATESDSEGGDITEVSPLSSPNLSPFLPRRKKIGAIHRKLRLESESEEDSDANRVSRDPLSNMKSLTDTLNQIETKRHHRHLTPTPKRTRRFNMSFSNDEVVRIDRDNQILLRKILQCHNRPASLPVRAATRALTRSANSLSTSKAVTKAKEQRRIDYENFILLKKIQSARPSSEIEESLRRGASSRSNGIRSGSSHSKERHHSVSSASAMSKPGHDSSTDIGWISW
ncbi:unnamed protein product [Notodromas monacha]|uniref:Cilia- and flagella-associated protein 97 n=1 Tax=Notodromas monacha TaxID=399045 RepID=A0A7R9GB41_9CRUS|nr:unnamed protein product [Notodromas monacha]CAG0915931.1 unnamed protein product [Notodromas monacha]